jgi:hypothetical protein
MGEVANSQTQVWAFLFNKTMPACKNCGKEFEMPLKMSWIKKIYCSDRCGKRASEKRSKLKHKVKKYCIVCSQELGRSSKFCEKCRPVKIKRSVSIAEQYPVCPCCGVDFIRTHGGQIYCGRCKRDGGAYIINKYGKNIPQDVFQQMKLVLTIRRKVKEITEKPTPELFLKESPKKSNSKKYIINTIHNLNKLTK